MASGAPPTGRQPTASAPSSLPTVSFSSPPATSPGVTSPPTTSNAPAPSAFAPPSPPPPPPSDLNLAREALRPHVRRYAPRLLRLALHDALTFDPRTCTGGVNGSIRLRGERERPENNEVQDILNVLDFVKVNLSNADLYQLAGILAVEEKGGPKLSEEFVTGREDAQNESVKGRFPLAAEDATELRAAFLPLGFEDKEIAALIAGLVLMEQDGSFTSESLEQCIKSTQPPKSPNLKKCLLQDHGFKKYVDIYTKDQDAFKKDYATAHKKMSNLGFKYIPPIEKENVEDLKKSMIVAATVTILVVLFGYFYETMYR